MTHDRYLRGCGCPHCNNLYERWLLWLRHVRNGATNNARLAMDLAASDVGPPILRRSPADSIERDRADLVR